jgi:hypothetical protein
MTREEAKAKLMGYLVDYKNLEIEQKFQEIQNKLKQYKNLNGG